MRLSPCVLVQPDGWARGEREGYGEPCDVTSLSLWGKFHSSNLYDRDACTVLSQKWMEQNSFRPLAVGCDNESLEACAKVGKLLARVLRH